MRETIIIFVERKDPGTGNVYCVESRSASYELDDARKDGLGRALESIVREMRAKLDAKEKEVRTRKLPLP